MDVIMLAITASALGRAGASPAGLPSQQQHTHQRILGSSAQLVRGRCYSNQEAATACCCSYAVEVPGGRSGVGGAGTVAVTPASYIAACMQPPLLSWVLAFEIFIPLVLFFILLGLRQKKPTISVKEVSFYTAAPLTSAGILPVMQSLCPDGQRDEFGFLQYANSTVTQLLERLNRVVEEGNLFDPARPSLGSELEALRQHLEALSSGPDTWESHLDRPAVSSFSLDSVARDPRELWRFLTQNLSLPNSTAQALLAAQVDLPEVYHLLFGSSPALDAESDLPGGQEPWSSLGSSPLFRMEELLLAPALLEQLTCTPGSGMLGRILAVPRGQQAALQGYRDTVCSGQAAARARRFSGLAAELRNQLDMAKIAHQLGIEAPNGSSPQQQPQPPRRLQALLEDLLDAQKVLQDVDILSALALLLPQGACAGRAPGPSASGPGGAANSTGPGAWAGTGSNTTAEEGAPSAPNALPPNPSTIEPEALRRGNMSSLGFTSKEQRNLGLLVHLMTSNPKILYAPAGSEADRVILKVRDSGALGIQAARVLWGASRSFLVSVLYSKAKLASACGGIIYFLSYVPYMYVAIREEVAHDKITAFEKCIASLMSTTAFGLGSKYFALYEVAGVGIQWHTFSQSPVEGDDFNLLLAVTMLMVDAAVYGVLTWYIEAVHPGMYGLPRPWYFPLQKSYWLGSGRTEAWEWSWPWARAPRLSVMEEDQACAMESRRLEEMRGMEEEPTHLPLVVCVDKLTKVYKNDKKLALNKLSLNLYENQVVSFLGHNGAGKTTTMSILTGLFPPTSGSATIYGHDIRTEMDEIRKNLGMCPQHNVLFDRLTVEEHLWFYSRLKSMAQEEIRKEMDNPLQHLEHSLDALHLSSFGLMDTTLEEVFLKVSEEDQSLENSEADVKESRKDVLPGAEGLASGEAQAGNLARCAELAQSQASLQSASSVGSARGEEGAGYADVYGDYRPLFDNLQDPDNVSLQEAEAEVLTRVGQGSRKLEGWWLKVRQFHGLLVKRFHCARRNSKALSSQILLPAFFVCVAMTVALSVPEIGDLPPLVLSPSQYHNYTQPRGNFIPYANEERREYRLRLSPDASPQQLVSTFRLPSGVGATCVLKSPTNGSLGPTLNLSSGESRLLAARFFDSMCLESFTQGLPLSNFVPPPPSPAPSDSPVSPDEDPLQAWNASLLPTSGPENWTSAPSLPHLVREPVRCICSAQGTGFSCPGGVGGHPPQMRVVTGDILTDITGHNVSEYLLFTSDRFRLHRYGAITFGNIQKSIPASFGARAPAMVRKIAVRRAAQVFYNNKGYHSMPTYLNTLNNAILRANLPKSKGNPAAYGITVTNHPMNKTSASLSLDYLLQGTDVVIAIFIIVAMSFVPASFVVFLVAEKSTKAKHLQFVSGCNPIIYWLANYVWDMLNYLVPATCCVIILFVFDLPAYTSPTNFPAVLSLFLLYGWSITPIMYPASFWFEVPSSAYVFLIVINLFIGITATVATFLLQLFEHDKDLKVVNSYLKSCFLIFPNYNLGHGLMEMAYNEYINEYYAPTGQFDKMKSPFEWDIVTRGLVAMTVEGFVGFFLTIMCQYNFLRQPQRMPVSTKPVEDDVDVANERQRVLRGDADNDMVKIENLTKVYKSRKIGRILAVDRLCLGVRPGECFGLLGVNGAGKTSTFKMLTGDESTTGGEAFVNGHSVLKELLQVQQSLGYCPQFDALFDELTAREHLQLYTRLRGIPWKDEARVVKWALEKLELTKYADKPAGTYSGGNKRKLSTAIALIGYPAFIFLDEPTTGMDPKARRFLWNLILDLIKTGRSVVLTSHSMEECEALCTRLAIMVNGRLRCLGSIQHLKNRFGDGYMITVRTKSSQNVKDVVRFFNRNFPEAMLKERHHTKVQYQLKSEHISLAQVFSKMEQVVGVLGIEDYSVSQTTLDNVFVNFAKKQSDNLEQQETEPPSALQSPLGRLLSLFRPRPTPTELRALVADEPEDLDTEDEGLISFEEERAQLSFNTDTLC
nr:PREDICTED: ATP-binding cassette sub-family A member 2 [Equus przewalskii]